MEEKQLSELVSNKLASINYDLVSLNVSRNNGSLQVSIVVDRVAPINMEDIVEVTNVLNTYLDEVDPFDTAYNLDISSLGAEKPLKVDELDKYVDSYVNVHVNNPIDGENIFEGTLKEVNSDSILITKRIKTRSKDVEVVKTNILKIRLAIKF
ncbi:MAG: ribosome maturation factor RimP [Bacilli bacterium]|nr:ribosome maturation factor RimP [Bacilli bacterium]